MWLERHSHKECEVISRAYLHLSHSGLFTSPTLDIL